jgi:hypothetical protein
MNLKEIDCWLDSCDTGYGAVAGSCEHGNEYSNRHSDHPLKIFLSFYATRKIGIVFITVRY